MPDSIRPGLNAEKAGAVRGGGAAHQEFEAAGKVKQYVRDLLPKIEGHGGIAIGTGNQISSYTEPANWIAMCEAVREWRG